MLNKVFSGMISKCITPFFLNFLFVFRIFLRIFYILLFILQFWFSITFVHFWFYRMNQYQQIYWCFVFYAMCIYIMGNLLYGLFYVLHILSCKVKIIFRLKKLVCFPVKCNFEILLGSQNKLKYFFNRTLYIFCSINIVNVFQY